MPSLQDLGLTEYESRVYRTLLRTGPTSAKQLSNTSGVPMGRIYDVLNDLEEAEFVRSQPASQPKKYAAVEPQTALSRLLEERRAAFEAELVQYEGIVEELADQLEDPPESEEAFWTVAVGHEDIADLVCERLAASNDHILMVATQPSAQFDLDEIGDRVATELEAALDRGVDISVLLSSSLLDTIPENLLHTYASVGEHPAFELRVSDDIEGMFNLIDRTEVCIEVLNPLVPGEALALIALKDPSFAARLYEEFEPRWQAAEPVAELPL